MQKFSFKFVIVVSLYFVSSILCAKNTIDITDVLMPKIPPVSRTAAIYLKLHNNTNHEIILTDVSTDVAHHTMIHLTQDVDGVAKMQHINELKIPANSLFEFSTNGYHIMLMGINKERLTAPFEVKLEFKNHPPIIFLASH